jgi:hypothetical protein
LCTRELKKKKGTGKKNLSLTVIDKVGNEYFLAGEKICLSLNHRTQNTRDTRKKGGVLLCLQFGL